ncbi:pilus assembly PilX family protein [Hydrogenophaga sp.]|uniref:pilus assembly PilX family protein n=1 Tax=Hydrogenophaga sp. TaxID=1904254 RepID=UPI003D0F42F5
MTRQHSQGFVLVTSLIFLIVLSLLGVMAMRGSLFEERMAANDREHAMAREFAELALRDAERDILGLHFDGTTYCASAGAGVCALRRPAGSRPANAADAGNFWIAANPAIDDIGQDNGGLGGAANIQGIYSAGAATACGMPVWSGAAWEAVSPACAGTIGAAVPTVQYGTFTDAPFNAPAGTVPPRYIIELFRADDLAITPTSNKLFFRITAVGFGRTTGTGGARTSVTLQSVFSPL